MVDWKDIHEDFSDKWHGNELKKSWQRQGFTPNTARPWFKVGFSPQDYNKVKKWNEAGFNSNRVVWAFSWKKHNFTPQQAQEWIQAGLEIENAGLAHYLRSKNYLVTEATSDFANWHQEYNQCWIDINPGFTKKIYRQNWEKAGFTFQEAKEWIEIGGLDYRSASFASHLQQESYTPQRYIAERVNWNGKRVKIWLDNFVPLKKRNNIESLDLSNFRLIGDLNLIGFTNLKNVFISGNPRLGVIINKPHKVIIYEGAQQWLGRKYSKKEIVEKIRWENGKDSEISGELTIADYHKCQEIVINSKSKKGLTSLKIVNCPQLIKLDCSRNKITELSVLLAKSKAKQSLIFLDVSHNKFLSSDLTSLIPFTNLEQLTINNNYCFGSLAPVQNLRKLKRLNIINTQIDSGLEYLPDSLQNFNCLNTKLGEELERLGEPENSNYVSLLKKWRELVIREKIYDNLLIKTNNATNFAGLSYQVAGLDYTDLRHKRSQVILEEKLNEKLKKLTLARMRTVFKKNRERKRIEREKNEQEIKTFFANLVDYPLEESWNNQTFLLIPNPNISSEKKILSKLNEVPLELETLSNLSHKTLEATVRKINQDVVRLSEVDPDFKEYNDSSIDIQVYLQNKRKIKQILEYKNWERLKNKLKSNVSQRKGIFEPIIKSNNYQGFYFWSQQEQEQTSLIDGKMSSNSEIIQPVDYKNENVKQNVDKFKQIFASNERQGSISSSNWQVVPQKTKKSFVYPSNESIKELCKKLGINSITSETEIKKAFRKKSLEYHPDKGGSNKSFQEIQEAYSYLLEALNNDNYSKKNQPLHLFSFEERKKILDSNSLNLTTSIQLNPIVAKNRKINKQKASQNLHELTDEHLDAAGDFWVGIIKQAVVAKKKQAAVQIQALVRGHQSRLRTWEAIYDDLKEVIQISANPDNYKQQINKLKEVYLRNRQTREALRLVQANRKIELLKFSLQEFKSKEKNQQIEQERLKTIELENKQLQETLEKSPQRWKKIDSLQKDITLLDFLPKSDKKIFKNQLKELQEQWQLNNERWEKKIEELENQLKNKKNELKEMDQQFDFLRIKINNYEEQIKNIQKIVHETNDFTKINTDLKNLWTWIRDCRTEIIDLGENNPNNSDFQQRLRWKLDELEKREVEVNNLKKILGTKKALKKVLEEKKKVEIDRNETVKEIVEGAKKWREWQLNKLREVKDEEIKKLKQQLTSLPIQEWTNIHPSFTPQLVQQWTNLNFTYSQTQDWINIGLTPTDYNFAAWLRDIIQETPINILNYGDINDLKGQFQEYCQTELSSLHNQLQLAYTKKTSQTVWKSWEIREELEKWIKELEEKISELESQLKRLFQTRQEVPPKK